MTLGAVFSLCSVSLDISKTPFGAFFMDCLFMGCIVCGLSCVLEQPYVVVISLLSACFPLCHC